MPSLAEMMREAIATPKEEKGGMPGMSLAEIFKSKPPESLGTLTMQPGATAPAAGGPMALTSLPIA